MNKIDNILKYLDKMFPDPKCELQYHNDFELLIAVVLSAQTTDKKVNKVTPILFTRYPSLKELKDAPLEDLYNILKPIGMYHKKAAFVKQIAADLYNKYNGVVPNNRKELESLSGVGRKTANVVLALLFNEPYIAVDTHVTRVSKRLGLALDEDNVQTIERKLMKQIDKSLLARSHYQLVLFGRYHCMAVKPKCRECQLTDICCYKKKHL